MVQSSIALIAAVKKCFLSAEPEVKNQAKQAEKSCLLYGMG